MAFKRGASAGLCGWLFATAALVALVVSDLSAEQALDVDLLMTDDVCHGGDEEACALTALQRRGLALEAEDEAEADEEEESSADVSGEGNRRRKYQAYDISVPWTKKLYSWIVYLHKNLTHLEWKMYYFKMDLNSSNNSLFHIKMPKSKRGVNGTRVDWNKHPAVWLPTFALAQEPAVLQLEGPDSLLEESAAAEREGDAEDETKEADVAGGRRRRSMKGVPPRKRKIQDLLFKQDNRLKDMWHEVAITKRKLGWMGNYMGANRRFYHKRPVLVQEAEARILESISEFSKPKPADKDDTWETEPEPQTELVKQIKSSIAQTADFWGQMRILGGMVQASKRRTKRWRRGTPANFLLQDAQESPEAWVETVGESSPEQGGRFGASLLVPAEEEDWGFSGSFGQCCRCKSGETGWSASGKCNFCKGQIAKQQAVATECQIQAASFKGSQACADACKTALGSAASTDDTIEQ